MQAMKLGRGAGNDWTEFKHRHRQAAVDSDLLYSVLQQAEQHHEVSPEDLCHFQVTDQQPYLLCV